MLVQRARECIGSILAGDRGGCRYRTAAYSQWTGCIGGVVHFYRKGTGLRAVRIYLDHVCPAFLQVRDVNVAGGAGR